MNGIERSWWLERISALTAERDVALAAVERVRGLHQGIVGDGRKWCSSCQATTYPCPTIRALDGE